MTKIVQTEIITLTHIQRSRVLAAVRAYARLRDDSKHWPESDIETDAGVLELASQNDLWELGDLVAGIEN